MEKCRSPLNPGCGSGDISVYIALAGKRIPVCQRCWEKIADSDLEWGEGTSEEKMRAQADEEKKKMFEKACDEALRMVVEKSVRSLKRRPPFKTRKAQFLDDI